jgi:hypothetical protein
VKTFGQGLDVRAHHLARRQFNSIREELMKNPARFCSTLFLFSFSIVTAAAAGQAKPASPAGAPVNIFKDVIDHKAQIPWRPAPLLGIPSEVCQLFRVCEDKGAPKLAMLPRLTEGGQPVGRGLFLTGTKDPKNPDAVVLEHQTVSELYFFLVAPDGSLQKAAYLQQGSTQWLPIASSLAKPVFEKDRNDWHDWIMKLGAAGK